MVEIIAEEQNKGKRMKRTEDSFRDLWDNITCNNIWIIGLPKEEEKNTGYDTIFEEIIDWWKFPQHGKEITQSSPWGAESSIQDKLKEKHTKTYINQTKKD